MARKPTPLRVPPPSYWRTRALYARARAERAPDPDHRECMLAIAETYDQIAAIAESPREPPPTAPDTA